MAEDGNDPYSKQWNPPTQEWQPPPEWSAPTSAQPTWGSSAPGTQQPSWADPRAGAHPSWSADAQAGSDVRFTDTWHLPAGFDHAGTPAGGGGGRGHRGWWIAGAVLVVVIVAVGLVNLFRNNSQSTGSSTALGTSTPSIAPAPTPSAGPSGGSSGGSGSSGGTGGLGVPAVACPTIHDTASHLTYSCIDNTLKQSDPDPFLGIRISLNKEVETGWVLSEGSGSPQDFAQPSTGAVDYRSTPQNAARGNGAASIVPAATPTASQVQAEVRRRALLALAGGYGSNPQPTVTESRMRSFSGVQGYELAISITIDPAYRAAHTPAPLKTKVEHLWVVGVPTQAGVSIFMLSIPDLRSDLWPKAEATIGSITVS